MTAGDHRLAVLIVEDDDQLRRLWSLSLRLEGFLTFEAADGLKAIAILEQVRVDALILDVLLPGIDGVAVRRELLAHPSTRSVPVIVVTASQVPFDRIYPDCLLRKPVGPAEVVEAVHTCVRRTSRNPA